MDSKKRDYLKYFVVFLKNNKQLILSVLVLFTFIFLYRACSFVFFKTSFHDFYFFDHSVWSFFNGKGLFIHAFNMSFWADHFYPWLLLFVPFYALVPSPFWMFIVQGLLAALLVYPILILASEKLGKDKIALIAVLLFFYLPFRLFGHDFHGELWQGAFLSWIILATEKRNDKLLFILLLGFPFLKENAVTFLSLIGFYLFFIKKRFLLGGITVLWGIISSFFVIGYFLPYFAHNTSSEYINTVNYSSNYSYLGEGLSDKLRTLFFNPLSVLGKFFSLKNIVYFIQIFAPLGFLSLFSPISLMIVGLFIQNALSSNLNFADITAHYSIVFTPVIFISAIFVYAKIINTKFFAIRIIKSMVIFFIVINFLYIVLFELRYFIPPLNLKAHYQAINQIPKDASVAADTHFCGYLQHRTRLYRVGSEPVGTQYIVLKKYPYVLEKDVLKYLKEKPLFVFYALLLGNVRRDTDIAENESLIQRYIDNPLYQASNYANIWVFKYIK